MTDRRDDPERPSEDLGEPRVDVVPAPRAGRTYDPGPVREQTRGWLAVGSFALLVITVGVILGVVACGVRPWSDMEGVAASVLPAVLGVVSSTLGFYYGRETRR